MESEFPANSQKQKKGAPEPAPKKKVRQIVTEGEVIRRKKPLGRRFRETFIQADGRTVLGFVAATILIPAFKDMLEDAGQAALHRMLRGESATYRRHGSSLGSSIGSKIDYQGLSNSGSKLREERSPRMRDQYKFDDFLLHERHVGEEILDQMMACIAEYEIVTVPDLYDMLGMSSNFTDDKWGWTDLRGASVDRVRGGYLLNLPRPKEIDPRS
jgi:hypothetical protein